MHQPPTLRRPPAPPAWRAGAPRRAAPDPALRTSPRLRQRQGRRARRRLAPWFVASLLVHLGLIAVLVLDLVKRDRPPEPLPPPAYAMFFESGAPDRPGEEGEREATLPPSEPVPPAPDIPAPPEPPAEAATAPPAPPAPPLPPPPATPPAPRLAEIPPPPPAVPPPPRFAEPVPRVLPPAPPPVPEQAPAAPPRPPEVVPQLPPQVAESAPLAPPPAPLAAPPPLPAPPRLAEVVPPPPPPVPPPETPRQEQQAALPLPPAPMPRPAPPRPQAEAPRLPGVWMPDGATLGPTPPSSRPSTPQRPPTRQAPLDLALGPAIGRLTPEPEAQIRGAKVGPDWRNAFRAWLEAHKRYPEAARVLGEQGTNRVELLVSPDGKVLSARLLLRSGSLWLDSGTMNLFRGANLPPFPPGADPAGVTVMLTMHYILIRN